MNTFAEKLAESLTDIISEPGQDAVLHKIAVRANELTASSDTVIFRCNNDDTMLCVSQAVDKNFLGIELVRDKYILSQAWNTGKPVWVNNYTKWVNAYDLSEPLVYHAMGAPLSIGDKIIGVMVSERTFDEPYSDDDFEKLKTFSLLASVELNNALSFEKLREANKELEELSNERGRKLSRTEEELRDKNEKLVQKNRQLNDLLIHIDEINESNQLLLAEYMHDDTLQVLYGTTLVAKSAIVAYEKKSENLGEILNQVFTSLQQMEKSLRRTIFTLKPFLLDSSDIVETIRKYAEQYKNKSGIQVHFESDASIRIKNNRLSLVLFQIIREALVNAYHHSKCHIISAKLEKDDGFFKATVRDDGIGFDYENSYSEGHFGIRIMKIRASSVGGDVHIYSRPGEGTVVEFKLPFNELSDI